MPSILFKTVEPLHFGSYGEFSPTARGPAALGRVSSTPLPSTILGVLTLLIRGKYIQKGGTLGDNYVELKKSIGIEDLYIRGPYFTVGEEVYITIDNIVINLGRLDHSCNVFRYIANCIANISPKFEYLENKYPIDYSKCGMKIIRFLGIGLNRDVKVPDEDRGLLYLEEYVDYDASMKCVDLSICVDITCGSADRDSEILERFKKTIEERRIVRLGGESRIALLEITESSRFLDLCSKYIEEDDYYLAINITPIILDIHTNNYYISIEDLSKLLFKDRNILIACIGKFGKEVLSVTSLGFNEVCKCRRPLKYSIPPGTLMILNGRKISTQYLQELCYKGIDSGAYCDGVECNKIGYNTVIILPLKRLPNDIRNALYKIINL